MGLMNWIKGAPAEKASETPDLSEGAALAGLNFMSAIDAHMKWKVRLERCLENDNKENLQVSVISKDDQCLLGKWIYGPGGDAYGHLPEFQEMKKEHARFHRCAGEVLGCCLAGDKQGAGEKLRGGDYVRASERVKLQLARLYVQATAK